MLPDKIAFVDIETTGTSFTGSRIIEIGVIRTEKNKVVEKFQTLLNPETFIPPEITLLTGIDTRSVDKAPLFSDISRELSELLKDCVFCAHNVRFDYSFVKTEFARQEISYRAKNLCTVKLSRRLFPEFKKHNLDSLIERFEIPCNNRHRAFDDAWVLWEFYRKVQKLFPEDDLSKAVAEIMHRPTVPVNLSEEALDSLPEKPGVYIFYSADGAPLYVGKSINIQDRVKSHFSSDHLSAKEMKLSQQVATIETMTTAGELGAFLTESQLVKKLQPLYNRQLRSAGKVTVLRSEKDSGGYLCVRLEQAESVNPGDSDNLLLAARNKKQAKNFLSDLAKTHQLCEKLLGLEKTKGACFGYRLGRCLGACVGRENPLKYNLRFITAISGYKIRQWPFSGKIAIEEKDFTDGSAVRYLFDQWCYLGEEQPGLDTEASDRQSFDLDTYRILRRFLASPANQKKIKILGKDTAGENFVL